MVAKWLRDIRKDSLWLSQVIREKPSLAPSHITASHSWTYIHEWFVEETHVSNCDYRQYEWKNDYFRKKMSSM